MTSDEAAFVPPGAHLSQGDVVDGIPWGAIDAPLTVCRPNDAKLDKGKSNYAPLSKVRNPFNSSRDKKEFVHARAGYGRGVVLWHDCEIDDYKHQGRPVAKAVAAVAPIFDMEVRIGREEDRLAIRNLRRSALFPIQEFESAGIQFEEGYVDLRLIWSVRQSLLIGSRVATMGAGTLAALYGHLFTFLTRKRVPERATCPACDTTFNVVDILPAMNEDGEEG